MRSWQMQWPMHLPKVSNSYGVQQGSTFINEYAQTDVFGHRTNGGPKDPNHTMGCYPWLWPYAMGGIKTGRPVDVPYNIHVHRLLRILTNISGWIRLSYSKLLASSKSDKCAVLHV